MGTPEDRVRGEVKEGHLDRDSSTSVGFFPFLGSTDKQLNDDSLPFVPDLSSGSTESMIPCLVQGPSARAG